MELNPPGSLEGRASGYVRAFSTLGCPGLNLGGVCALARSYGVGAVELRVLESSVDLPAYFSRLGTAPATLSAVASAEGIRIAAIGTSLRLIDGTDEDREKFLEFVPWAEAMDVPRLRVFDGGSKADDVEMKRALAAFTWWRAIRAERGWKTDIMVETHDALLSAAAIDRFTREVPGAAILWDSHHTWRKGGEDPAATWRAIGRHVVHIHVKDSVGGADAGSPARYVLPGTGEFPMADLRAALAGDYTGPLSLEWERLWHPELAPLEEALRSSAATSWW
ncbi:MAG TPA: TIM barrel protein [Opitutaceae bacterium]|nr:TIM barrel protein [Opitutaceae bacterium]